MKYDLSDNTHAQKAYDYLESCMQKGQTVEIKVKRPRVSVPQNAYLHVCFTALALEVGCSIEQAKDICKRHICPNIFLVHFEGIETVRSCAELDTLETTTVIEMLRTHMVEFWGEYIPAPDEQAAILEIENESIKQQQYLEKL